MGSAKRSHARSQQNARTRTTRSSKGRLLTTDPNETAALLTNQLSILGLYAAPTLGDGNCLFRALSDQYYGTSSRHVQVRKDVCDWIEQHKERYEEFVDEDEFGAATGKGHSKLDVYLKRMRQNATYGGHMELSAFAHLTRRNIKVIQPGLVYVIQWNPSKSSNADESMDLDDTHNDRRNTRRRQKKSQREFSDSEEEDGPTIYVAYHDWEHFSSIRNLKGPHVGLPCIEESPPSPASAPADANSKKIPKVKLKVSEPSASKPPSSSSSKPPSSAKSNSDPLQIPLPPSSAPSPAPSRSLSPVRPSAIPPLVASSLATQRVQRSPKRSFDESSASSEGSSALESGESAGKRRRTRSTTLLGVSMDVDAISELSDDPNEDTDSASSEDEDQDIDVEGGETGTTETLKTPFLSPASSGSSTSSSSLTSLSSSMSISPSSSPVNIISQLITGGESPLSSVPSPTPSPPPEPEVVKKEVKQKPLTRRERKRLGLPKPRPALVDKNSAGKIVIPGGRYLRNSPQSQTVGEDDGDEEDADPDAGEWRNNGSGRVDVRGFRELKI